MNRESPLELDHVRRRLHGLFDGLLAPATKGDAEQRERNFLSRALAAYAVVKLAECTPAEAVASVVDGGGDFGLDAIYYSGANGTLWLVQSKFISSGHGEASLTDVGMFCNGADALLRGDFAPFHANAAVIARKEEIIRHLRDAVGARMVLVYTGVELVTEDRRFLFDRVVQNWATGGEYLSVSHYNLTSVHDWVTGIDDTPGVASIQLVLRKPGWVREPFETVYGCVTLRELFELYEAHGRRLVAANLRAYKGATDINDVIEKTIATEPQHFFYLNNGLTAYCERFVVENVDRPNMELKRITAYGVSIVNGAQTLGSIAAAARRNEGVAPDGFVFLKLISLNGCEDDRAFAARITQSTNFQNRISQRDFVALEEEQHSLAATLELSGIYYHFKDADDVPAADPTNFGLDEATTALACLEQQPDCDLLSRVLAKRDALWSFDPVYPAGSSQRSRYGRLFKFTRSARSIWRAVQVQRAVKGALRSTERGVRKEFFENGRWLVLNIIFQRHHPERGEALALADEEKALIVQAAQEYAEVLWTICQQTGFVSTGTHGGWDAPRHFRSVFSNAADCQMLRSALLARLA